MIVGVRPENAHLWREGAGLLGPLSGRIEHVEMLGRETLIGVMAADNTRLVLHADAQASLCAGDAIPFGIEPGRMHLFEEETKEALGRL